MKNLGLILKIAFTFIGTVVGAGFASGQEILYFFSQYGPVATYTIGLSSIIFLWIGIRLMTIARCFHLHSYHQLNELLFGEWTAHFINRFTLIMLLGSMGVMLAGGATILQEQFHIPFSLGSFFSILLAYCVLTKGIHGIMNVNTLIVPLMLFFIIYLWASLTPFPKSSSDIFLELKPCSFSYVYAPFLYTAYNLAMAQTVLVPLGAKIQNHNVLIMGGIMGGLGIGILMYGTHLILQSQVLHHSLEEIPMSKAVEGLGQAIKTIYTFVLLSEMFTTFIANGFGILSEYVTNLKKSFRQTIVWIFLIVFLISHVGFASLLTFLYPLFGWVSLLWLIKIFLFQKGRTKHAHHL